jgi:hypothetical protein
VAHGAGLPPTERAQQNDGEPEHRPQPSLSPGLGVHQRQQQAHHTTTEEQ